MFIKSVPVVCFIVLLLIWFGSLFVSPVTVFLVAFPAVYSAVLEAMQVQNQKMGQLLKVFQVSGPRRALAFHWPSLLPFLLTASRVGVSMSWRAGVAAELIGLPLGSIGVNIYYAKLTFSTAQLFSWTIVIVLLSLICERLFMLLLRQSESWAWQIALPRLQQKTTTVDSSKLPLGQAGNGESEDSKSSGSPEAHPGFGSPQLASYFDELSLSYDMQTVISEFSWQLKPGACYALRGDIGSGKTIIISLLAGIVQPSSGIVQTNGKVSAVFQESRLFEQHSALDNVQLFVGHFASRNQILEMLSILLPAESLDKPVMELSGGMRRCVELVRALLFPSQLLLLDEPFSGLDDNSKALALQLLTQELHGRTLVLATHDSEDEQLMDLEVIPSKLWA